MPPKSPFVYGNLTASAANIRIAVEYLPHGVQAFRGRACADVKKDTDIWLEDLSKGVEEPSVGVDLFLVILFHQENDLRRDDSLVRVFEVQVRVDTNCIEETSE